MEKDVCFLSASELSEAYSQKRLFPSDVVDAVLDRIEKLNPTVNAFFYVDAAGARENARQSTMRWKSGSPLSQLDGVPYSVKDHILTQDMPSVWGVPGIDDTGPWTVDAPIVARLREAGAVLLGKTTQPEMAMFCSGISGRYGITRNPWNINKTPGGSSSGAAAAVPSGMGPIAIGSDAGGSVRIPAAYTGVVGHKPTYGRIPFYPPYGLGLTYGPMTRTVEDAAHVMTVITKPDWRDIHGLPWDNRDYAKDITLPLPKLRIAYSDWFGYGVETDNQVKALVEHGLEYFRSIGADIVRIPPFFDFNLYEAIMPGIMPMMSIVIQSIAGPNVDKLLPELRALVEQGKNSSLPEFFHAKAMETEALVKIASVLKDFDFLITPTMPTEAYEADRCFPEGVSLNSFGYNFDYNPFTWPFNSSLQPAISVPCGVTTNGLPVGMQIVGHRGDDIGCLRMAHAYESNREPMPTWPKF